jgi:hypothetical protein
MDKRVIGLAILAFVISLGVIFAEATLVGILAAQSGPTAPHDITLTELEWRGLWHSVLFAWGLPSALGALLIACFKPCRWAWYSAFAVLPHVAEIVYGAVSYARLGIPFGYSLLSGAVNLALLPLFLWLYYATIRRHMKAA